MDVQFIGRDLPGHEITGDANQEAGTMTLTCSCRRWGHSVHYRDNTVKALQELADAGLDHIVAVRHVSDTLPIDSWPGFDR